MRKRGEREGGRREERGRVGGRREEREGGEWGEGEGGRVRRERGREKFLF